MRVCLFLDNLDKKGGGPARSVPIMAKGLAGNGVDVTLMACESDDINDHSLDNSNVKLIIIPRSISYGKLEELIINSHFDIIHEQCVWLPIYHMISKIAQKHNIPYIISPRGCLEPWCYNDPNIISWTKKHLAMALYQRRDINKSAIIFATADMEANNIRKLGFKNPISIVPNGLEIESYACRPNSSIEVCKKRVLYISRITPKKGVDLLIEAWAEVSKKHPNWTCAVYGNGEEDYINQLKKMVTSNSIDNSFSINPPIFGDDKYKAYIESSLFVLPTHSENFGMVIAEALSCGLPVITTTGTPWASLQDSQSGWWIDLSTEMLIETLDEALSKSSHDLFEMGQRGALMVHQNYNYIEVAKKIMDAYKWVLYKGERPSFINIVQ